MPLIFAIVPVLIIEALTFWAVASWLGVGWALILLFALMAFGLISAGVEMRRVSRLAAAQRISAGRLAGDYGLLTAGAILAGTPGIASSVVGLFLIFPPTRSLVRKVLAVKLIRSVEDFGVRSFKATTAGRSTTSYGSFVDPEAPRSDEPAGEVIDESEIEEWTRDIRPEDFGGKPGDRE